jgi:hypothetical protein
MALYDTRFGLPQSMVDYLNQGLPDIYQNIDNPPPATIGPGPDEDEGEFLEELYPQNVSSGGDGYSVYNPDPNMTRTKRNYVNPFPYDPMDDFGTSNYGYPGSPRTGIMGLYDQYKNLPTESKIGLGTMSALSGGSILPLGAGVVGIGKLLGGMFPPSKAGIFQNELLGANFMLDNTGRIVSNNYNTPEGIMAGYNPVSGGLLNLLTGGKSGDEPTYGLDKSYDKRRETVSKTLKEKYGMTDAEIAAAVAGEYEGDVPINPATGLPTDLINRLGLFNQSQNLLNKKLSAADIIYNRKLEERRESDREFQKQKAIEDAAKAKRDIQQYTSGGGGGSKTPDYSNVTTGGPPSQGGGGGGPPSQGGGSKSSKSSSKNSSQAGGSFNSLGFSDIRLKENIELIGKSPSNINIYKFNYKNNPTTYQGAMAHEVPWASVKHSNGYMMVDYNLLDVDFKKYNA